MIRTNVNNDSLLEREPSLDSICPKMQNGTFDTQINAALGEIIQKLKQQKRDIKKYCSPLSIPVDGSTSGEDTIERMMLVFNTSAVTDDAVIVFYGSNNGTDWTSIGIYVVNETGTKQAQFYNPFKFYKIIATGGTITFTAELVETSFYHAHLFLSLALIYEMLRAEPGDIYERKADTYMANYENSMNLMVASYDENLDGDISDEEEAVTKSVSFIR